jgi:hypothetical protein
MPKKSSSPTTKKNKTDSKNKALYKATSLLPTTPLSSVPAVYMRALPMIIGVITILVLIILPTTRSAIFNLSKKTSDQFSTKTDLLQANLLLSLQTGLDAYVKQIKENIEILPIDSDLESKNYLGRAEASKFKKVETDTFAEKAHYMTASISQSFTQSFEYFK